MSPLRNVLTSSLLLASLALSTACTLSQRSLITKPIDSMMGNRGETEERLATAAAAAIAAGETGEALAKYQALYAHRPRDESVALNYAQLLRQSGKIDQAQDILKPFVATRVGALKKDVNPLLLNEYAAILIAQGAVEEAEAMLDRMMDDPRAEKIRSDTTHLLGIALDAQGRHKEAEKMFRAALGGWKGNPSTVMNNLGLCLAAESLFDESLLTLRRALVMAPDKREIAGNIQLVEHLRAAVIAKAPAHPAQKKKRQTQ